MIEKKVILYNNKKSQRRYLNRLSIFVCEKKKGNNKMYNHRTEIRVDITSVNRVVLVHFHVIIFVSNSK